ncbi:hypothetical protein BO78DRAFT_30015 [Aspergillus sclerotiicarbonarius CBS 121057]|uniref:Xylanolytic transcriptional activator regulatory domain-containing protein n=1 Tax=Aspergillus sclerotiicarbonarius (strain CBS 121057 / IBT 28362) TaxID=1448318 RepID=A0A319DT08_ASPSB|nr:hypothetical protein BO78DRAFT_30015 [Aspergillus sclerotiicarbonarius CBS 121057]
MVQSAESPSNLSTPLLRRARVACKACNARRVKCDAAEGQPCWHYRTRQTPCELIESRRGKYTRKKRALPRDRRVSQRLRGASTEGAPDATATSTQSPQKGDPSCLSYIVEVGYRPSGGSTEPLQVHYPIPASIADRPPPDNRSRVEEPVSLQDAFVMPAPEIADQLIRTFFDVVHPAYPVLDRKNFTRLYHQGQASPLVLHSIFLLGFTIGTESLVQAAGYSDRAVARKTHYLRAKALYDADYDTDPMNLTAALLLLGFWWAGPEDQKDSCYWVGCAAMLAQSMGMHLSTSPCSISQPLRSMRKRIWWSIYIRDRHTSAAFGQPCRIRDEDCDVDLPTEEDLNFDVDYDEALIPGQKDFHTFYFLEMTKLATILGDILISEFSPRRPALSKFDTEVLTERLIHWESQLPNQLQKLPPDGSLNAPFWASMLHIAYQNYHILLFRPKAIENLASAEAERDIRARMAADSVTRIAEDLLAADTIKFGQIHLVPALFGALSIHTLVICRQDPVRRQLAENKSRQCVLALSEVAKHWPVKVWIAKAFVNLLRRLTGQGSASGGSIVNVSSSIASTRGNVAPSGHWGLLGLQPTISPRSLPSHFLDGEQSLGSVDRAEPSTPQRELAPDYILQTADQLICDSFWAGCLDNTYDVDLLLPHALGTHPVQLEGSSGEPGLET